MTKEQWSALGGKGQWDIMVALRGPDAYYGEALKWYTSSVIRGQMKDILRAGGLVNSDLQLVILPNHLDDPEGASRWNCNHFYSHIYSAACWLHVPTLFVPARVWYPAMQYEAHQAGVTILDQVKPSQETAYLLKELGRHVATLHR